MCDDRTARAEASSGGFGEATKRVPGGAIPRTVQGASNRVKTSLSFRASLIAPAGHANSRTTETIYRHELRPVITTGADVMDKIFTAAGHEG